jgi:ribosomal-protein-alanine N-acetyltransferase
VKSSAMPRSEGKPQPIIRPLKSADAAAIAALEGLCPEAAQWGIDGYPQLDSGEINGWAAEIESELLAFVIVRIAADEIEILNLAANPIRRRQGLATKLLASALAAGKTRGARRAFLEVRNSNSVARAFYHSQGFRETGRRKDYYSHPYEDAIVLRLPLT